MNPIICVLFLLAICSQEIFADNIQIVQQGKHVKLSKETPYIDFSQLQWTITNPETTKEAIHLSNVTIPAYPITELAKLKKIPNPLKGYGDTELRWLSFEKFQYVCEFAVHDWDDAHGILRFEGLDTIATIQLNDNEIGKTDNMFAIYEIDVTKYLQQGKNTLTIVFDSAPSIAKTRQEHYPYTLPVADPKEIKGEPSRNFLRKAQYSFGWDWGPSFPVSGIYRPIYLYKRKSPILTHVRVITNAHPHMVHNYPSKFTIYIKGHVEFFKTSFEIEVSVYNQQYRLSIDSEDFEVAFELNVQVEDLWMPVGIGAAKLQKLVIESKDTNQQIERLIGFRSVILDMNSFKFVINGIPIFAKGSNVIPMSVFQDDYTEKDIDRVLLDAVNSNMNMIRVWGGGIYQSDYFYDRCDELGLLVWQELMFACQMTPIYEAFMNSVEKEIDDQVNRLIHHPSIVLWSGNNENEVSLFGNTWYSDVITPEVKSRYVSDYWELTQRSFKKVLSLDVSRPFWLSSPSRGYIILDNEGTITGDWGYPDGSKGDTHHYNYKDDCTKSSNMPKSHFVSEYGFQSLPSLSAWKSVSNESLSFDADIVNHRQHHPNGNKELQMQISMYFTTPSSSHSNRFEKQIYLTQAMQALCMKSQTEFYRGRMINKDIPTYGALYWQHNSVWVAPTWSGIEATGRYKMLQYAVKRFFAPLHVVPVEDPSSLFNYQIVVINELIESFPNMKLQVDYLSYSEDRILHTLSVPVSISARETLEVFSINIAQNETCLITKECFLRFSLINDANRLGVNFLYPNKFKDISLHPANVTITNVHQVSSNEIQFDLATSDNAYYVWLVDQEPSRSLCRFSENHFEVLTPTVETPSSIHYVCPDSISTSTVNDMSIFHLALMQ